MEGDKIKKLLRAGNSNITLFGDYSLGPQRMAFDIQSVSEDLYKQNRSTTINDFIAYRMNLKTLIISIVKTFPQ